MNFSKCFYGMKNICELNDLKIKIWRNYVIDPNDNLIILSTPDIQIKLKKYVGL